jgi:histidyl-tRNA synthetase
MHCGDGSFKNQIKRADKSGAMLAVILGEDEYKEGKVAIKLLRDNNGAQRSVNLEHMISSVAELLTQID